MKQKRDNPMGSWYKSPPMRGRGLKPSTRLTVALCAVVAPHAGAWIETTEQ